MDQKRASPSLVEITGFQYDHTIIFFQGGWGREAGCDLTNSVKESVGRWLEKKNQLQEIKLKEKENACNDGHAQRSIFCQLN